MFPFWTLMSSRWLLWNCCPGTSRYSSAATSPSEYAASEVSPVSANTVDVSEFRYSANLHACVCFGFFMHLFRILRVAWWQHSVFGGLQFSERSSPMFFLFGICAAFAILLHGNQIAESSQTKRRQAFDQTKFILWEVLALPGGLSTRRQDRSWGGEEEWK